MRRGKNRLDALLTAEAVRGIEESGQELPAAEQIELTVATSELMVEERILQRANLLAAEADVAASLSRVRRLARNLSYAAIALFTLLGALASMQAFAHTSAQVNFYWLLFILLGINLASLIAWVVGLWLSKRAGSGAGNALGQASSFLLKKLVAGMGRQRAADPIVASAWLGVMLDGRIGRWSLSRLSHTLWSGYLIGGLVMILLLFATRQYNFVWETTLLDDRSFVHLTQLLAVLPDQVGFSTPDIDQITGSRLGADAGALASARKNWASLLIASLLLYGIVPRLLLLALSSALLSHALRNARLQLSRPYYVRLRQRIMPVATPLGVVDPDEEAPHALAPPRMPGDVLPIPAGAYWLGIELGPQEPWPFPEIATRYDLGNINDRASQHQATAAVKALGGSPLVLAVSLQRSPDRGLGRIISQLVAAHPRSVWLVLLESTINTMGSASERDARLCDWYALAENCGIEADRITQRVLVATDPRHRAGNG